MAHVGAVNFRGGLKDISGYNHPMEYVGSPLPAVGRYDQGLACFGGNGFRIFWKPGSYYGDIVGGKSFQFWVKADPGAPGVVRVLYHRFTYKIYLADSNGYLGALIGGTMHTTTTNICDSQWHHVLYSWNRVAKPGDTNNTHRFWVDGVLVAEVVRDFSYSESTNEWGYFGLNADGGEPADAILSDIKVWNDPVYPDEVTYFRDLPVSDTNRGLYAFDTVTSKLRDSSQHGNHLLTQGTESLATAHHGNGVQVSAETSYAYNPGPMDRISMLFWLKTANLAEVGTIIELRASGVVKFGLYHTGGGVLRYYCVRDTASTGTTDASTGVARLVQGTEHRVLVQAWASEMQLNVDGDANGSGGGSVSQPINMPSFNGIDEMRIGANVVIDNLRIISNWIGGSGAPTWLPTEALVEPKLPGWYRKGGAEMTARMKITGGYTDLVPSGVEIVTLPDPPTNFDVSDVTYEAFTLHWTPPDIAQDDVNPSTPTGLDSSGVTHQQFTLAWQEATDA